jgi:RNA polymerase sigma-70 factor, ECF subfamily
MSKEEKNIPEIILGCKNGDRKSQEGLYKMYYGKMMGVCLRYTNDPDEAKDVLQDGFIKVFSNITKFDNNGSFEGWVRRIIVNTAIDNFRKSKNPSSLMDHYAQIENLDRPDDGEEEKDSIYFNIKPEDILAAVQKLSPAYRTVFNLYAIDGFSHQQIAEELKISIGTSKSNYAKAKQNLKKLLQSKLVTEHEG